MAQPLIPRPKEVLITPPAIEASLEDGQRLHNGDINTAFEEFMTQAPVEALAATLLINAVGEQARTAVADGKLPDDPHEIARFSSKATFIFLARALKKMQAREMEDASSDDFNLR